LAGGSTKTTCPPGPGITAFARRSGRPTRAAVAAANGSEIDHRSSLSERHRNAAVAAITAVAAKATDATEAT
jgi:hypothetical protein